MRQLHPEAIAAIQSKALFSQAEEALLAKISSVRTSRCIQNVIFLINVDCFPPPRIDESVQTGNLPGAFEQTPSRLSLGPNPQEPPGSLAATKTVLPAGRPNWYDTGTGTANTSEEPVSGWHAAQSRLLLYKWAKTNIGGPF